MLKYILRFFAFIGFVTVALFAAGIAAGVHQQKQLLTEPENVVLFLDLDQPIVEQEERSALSIAMHEDATTLFSIVRAIDKAKDDPHVKGIVARFGSARPSVAQAQEIRTAIARFRDSKKFTYAFAASYGSFGLGNTTYYTASAFDDIWLQPVGSVSLTGLAVQSPFVKKALDKAGIKADFMQRKEYKSFMEMAQRDDFSPPVRDMTQAMVNDLADQISSGIAQSRQWDQAHVKDLMAKGPFTDKEALAEKLVTHIGYGDEVEKEVKDKAGAGAKIVALDDYVNYRSKALPQKPKATIALIYGVGAIVDHADGAGGLSRERMMDADTIADAFDAATEDKRIKAILFRIDSPGGSPEASETIRRAMVHAQMKGKPVFVSMGDVAASGGYWIAMNADHITASPGTLTGSIGVVSGKFVVGGLMDKLGVSMDGVKTSDAAGMWSMQAEFTPAQRARVDAMLDATYETFTKNVSEARKIPFEKMDDVAKGRVWTGQQGLKIGLIDELGGYDASLDALRKKLDLTPDDVIALKPFPAPESPIEKLEKLLKGFGAQGAMIGAALTQWQNLQASLGISVDDVLTQQPVSARMSPSYVSMTH